VLLDAFFASKEHKSIAQILLLARLQRTKTKPLHVVVADIIGRCSNFWICPFWFVADETQSVYL